MSKYWIVVGIVILGIIIMLPPLALASFAYVKSEKGERKIFIAGFAIIILMGIIGIIKLCYCIK